MTQAKSPRINKAYRKASLRVVSNVRDGHIGIGFDVAGETIRVSLDANEAATLSQLIRDHSAGSSGMPSSDVSSTSPVEE